MALVRILVDGYSLLHRCPGIAPGRPRFSAAARDELITLMTRYHDAVGTPITVIFDGSGASGGGGEVRSTREVEVLFSRAGQTADEMIERVAHRMRPFGEVLVVTDDVAERETVQSVGGMTSNCANFLTAIADALNDVAGDLKHLNRRERAAFTRPPHA